MMQSDNIKSRDTRKEPKDQGTIVNVCVIVYLNMNKFIRNENLKFSQDNNRVITHGKYENKRRNSVIPPVVRTRCDVREKKYVCCCYGAQMREADRELKRD